MDAIFTRLLGFARHEGNQEGRLREEFSTRLDGLFHALSETNNLVTPSLPAQVTEELLAGLETVQQIARQAVDYDPSQASGYWSICWNPTRWADQCLH
jgi:hypothetical protein